MERLEAIGEDAWFRLGDRDLATHMWRTDRLRAGERPTDVAHRAGDGALGIGRASCRWPTSRSAPRSAPTTAGSSSRSTSSTATRSRRSTRSASAASRTAAPRPRSSPRSRPPRSSSSRRRTRSSRSTRSSPCPACRTALDGGARPRHVPIVAVSGIVGGKALKGPADRMLASLGHESSAPGSRALRAARQPTS